MAAILGKHLKVTNSQSPAPLSTSVSSSTPTVSCIEYDEIITVLRDLEKNKKVTKSTGKFEKCRHYKNQGFR